MADGKDRETLPEIVPPRAISAMFSLVVDASCRNLSLEVEITFEDGTTRNVSMPARRSVRIDLDMFYAEAKRNAG